MSPETSEKFFEFMKDLACTCERLEGKGVIPDSFNFKTSLNLCQYKSAEDFVESQEGDKHLPSESEA